jgi:hypothetical protein
MSIIFTLLFSILSFSEMSSDTIRTIKIDTINKPEDCITVVKYLQNNLNQVDLNYIKLFIKSFSDSSCINNVEFNEYGNYVLFKLIEKRPTDFFKVLFNQDIDILFSIKYQLDSPVNDGINIINVYNKVKKSNMPFNIKQKALSLLKYSYEKEIESIKNWELKNNKKWKYPK